MVMNGLPTRIQAHYVQSGNNSLNFYRRRSEQKFSVLRGGKHYWTCSVSWLYVCKYNPPNIFGILHNQYEPLWIAGTGSNHHGCRPRVQGTLIRSYISSKRQASIATACQPKYTSYNQETEQAPSLVFSPSVHVCTFTDVTSTVNFLS